MLILIDEQFSALLSWMKLPSETDFIDTQLNTN